jgi:hypothetical protein
MFNVSLRVDGEFSIFIALIHIHYAKTVDLNKVVEMFAKRHPRKNELQSIIFDY